MRICYHCGRVTSGQPLFCNWCSRSYSVRLCPRLHPNPRSAEACSQCGSRDLSIPQEKLPLWFRPLMFFAGVLPGAALLLISILYICYFTYRLFTDPYNLLLPMLFGLSLGLAWAIWMHIPFVLL